MGLDKYSAGSFEEMAEAQEAATEKTATEANTEATPVEEVKADNVETPKTE